MNRQEFFEQWIAALESGKYKQARYALRTVNKAGGVRFCCLGVACVVANENIEKQQKIAEVLPNKLARKLNIARAGTFKKDVEHKGKYYASLAELNDSGVGFKTIAKIIRKQLAEKNFVSFEGAR